MPRTITSQTGSRTMTIEDNTDNFTIGADNFLPNGDAALKVASTPNADAYMHDRAASNPFLLIGGSPKTILWWTKSVDTGAAQQNDPFKLGVMGQNSGSLFAFQWYVFHSGNGRFMQISIGTGSGVQTIALGSGANDPAWVFMGFVYDPTSNGPPGFIRPYFNGAPQGISNLGGAPKPEAFIGSGTAELCIGGSANYALSNVTSTPAVDTRIAKLSAFNVVLSDAQIAALYTSMTS